ncbi:MAG: ABC transporter permease subunit [Planctomycetota bacterium]|nr:ABC transporter permease subunit [Planctomycetota bacterium]
MKSFILGVKSTLAVHLFRAKVGHSLFWVSAGFLLLVAAVVVSVSFKNQWNYKTLKPRGQAGFNLKNSIEMIEAGSMALGHNAGVSAVCSAVSGASSGLLIQSGFPVFTKNVVFSVLLGFLLPLWCLTFAVEGLGSEREGKTLFWLFSKPVPRSSIYVGKFLAILPWVIIWSLGGFFVLAVCAGDSGIFAFKLFWQPIALASITYASVFFFMGACLPRASLIALAYAFVVETLLGSMPGSLKQLSVAFYARCIMFQKSSDLGVVLEQGGGYGDFSQTMAICFMLGIALMFLVAGIFFFGKIELRGQR